MTAFLITSIKNIFHSKLNYLSLQLISLFSGFFISTMLSTMPSQTGDWGIIAAAIIVACNEFVSKLVYSWNNNRPVILRIMNCVKIGIVYGLFVDAFKLGS